MIKETLGQEIDKNIQRSTGEALWGTVLVAKDGEVVLARGYGFADHATIPNSPMTLFEISSVSKQFTAAAILKLEMEGNLCVDDPISNYLKNVPGDKKEIRVRHLLAHTSGIDPDVGLAYDSPATRDEFVAFMLKAPLVSEPDQYFDYSNSAYGLLAAIVEVASGQSFEDYVREKIFVPAGCTDTGFIGDENLVDSDRNSTRVCEWMPDASAADWCWGWGYRGMGGVVTTACDLMKWDRALRGDAVLDVAATEKLFTPYKDDYAFGWFVESTERGTTKAYHDGYVDGYQTLLARYIEEDVLIVILTNLDTDIDTVERAIDDVVFINPVLQTFRR